MSQDLLTLRGLKAGYGATPVIGGVDLSLAKGEVLAVIGRNGVGKTTLLRAIVGNLPFQDGQVAVNGKDLSKEDGFRRARAGVAYVPQGRHVFPNLTVMENLETGLSARRDGKKSVPDEIFDLFPKLTQLKTRQAGFLSGGEQQQLAIGRALTAAPDLLLLDEPTEGIQPNVVQQIEDVLGEVRHATGMTVIVVEQYLDFVWRFADRFIAMQGGAIVHEGATADSTPADIAHLVQI